MNPRDWTLIAIALAGDDGLSPVQLQKSLFVLGRELPSAVGRRYYKFIPYNYGPFSKQVYSDAEQLATSGLVSISQPIGRRWNRYSTTQSGRLTAEQLQANADPRAVEYLRAVVSWVKSLPFAALVREIYKKYPQFKANSVFQG